MCFLRETLSEETWKTVQAEILPGMFEEKICWPKIALFAAEALTKKLNNNREAV